LDRNTQVRAACSLYAQKLGVLARQVDEMQVKVMLLESFDDRVTSLAALKPNEIKKNIGASGALVPSQYLSRTNF